MTPTCALADMFHLTDRQAEIFAFIVATVTVRGYGPTLREIGRNFGIRSTNGVAANLAALRKKGALTWERGNVRTLRPRVRLIHPSQLSPVSRKESDDEMVPAGPAREPSVGQPITMERTAEVALD
jgi:repressor LexA